MEREGDTEIYDDDDDDDLYLVPEINLSYSALNLEFTDNDQGTWTKKVCGTLIPPIQPSIPYKYCTL